MIILTERTPNPEAMRFNPQSALTAGESRSFERTDFAPSRSALAAALFALEGVRSVFIAPDFVTVLRDPGGPGWSTLRYEVIAALAAHLASGEPAFAPAPDAPAAPAPSEIEAEIRQILGLHVRAAVARDGGDILFDRFDPETGTLWIRMVGACGGCPSSQLTLRAHVERIVRRYVPEVLAVDQVASDEVAESAPARMKRWLAGFGKSAGEAPARTLFTHAGRDLRRPG
ncbi:MAG TPA: NifU family protein [Phenylobacterium sp.]|nr:NifU family protein [Phenylobacterium sp.]